MVAKVVLQLTLVLGIIAVTNVIGQRNIALSGPEIELLRLGQNPKLLEFAALTLETVVVIIEDPEVVAVVQENVNADFWCLPWLQKFPGGSIRWLLQRTDVITGDPVAGTSLLEISGEDPLLQFGGEFNEWLNLTSTILVPGAVSTSNGLYICEVCLFRGTQFEECHFANTSLQVIGGPPILDVAIDNNPVSVTGTGIDTENEYLIGSDFCIDPNFRGIVTILCQIVNAESYTKVSRAFPVPFRSWSLDEDLLYSELSTSTPSIVDKPEFYLTTVERMVLMPQYFFPEPVLSTPLVGRLQGGIQLNFELFNASFAPLFDSLGAARRAAYQAVVGAWTCRANNAFGSDMATSNIRICAAPDVQVCSRTQSPQTGDVVPVGCTVCIPEGDVATLNCTGRSVSEVFYEWRNGAGIVVSTSPLHTTGAKDSYTCTATNLDHIPAIFVSMVAFRNAVTFTVQTKDEFSSSLRMDNGCSRLNNQAGLESVAVCAFVGETLELNCATDDNAMVPLEITAPDGSMVIGSLIVSSVDIGDEGTYSCQLSNDPGPCGQATEQRKVRVFGSTSPPRVTGFCSVVVWTIPTRSYGRITGYDVRFVSQGSGLDLVVSKKRRENFHLIRDTGLTSTDNIMVQVRAKTTAADGKWSELVPLGCKNAAGS